MHLNEAQLLRKLRTLAEELREFWQEMSRVNKNQEDAIELSLAKFLDLKNKDTLDEDVEQALLLAGISSDSPVQFIIDEDEPIELRMKKALEIQDDFENWKEIENEILDFLDEHNNTFFILQLFSAKADSPVPGFFEVEFGTNNSTKEKTNELLIALKKIFEKAHSDNYPLRLEFHRESNMASRKLKAIIKNYDDNLNIDMLFWEEYQD